jgi:hypothetical protein
VNVLISFAIAALLGLTWLAYKYHAVYVRLVPVLVAVFLLIYFGTIVWDASVTHTFRKLGPYLPIEKLVETNTVRLNLLIWNSWVSLAVIGSNVYLVFLLWGVPWLLRDGQTPTRSRQAWQPSSGRRDGEPSSGPP